MGYHQKEQWPFVVLLYKIIQYFYYLIIRFERFITYIKKEKMSEKIYIKETTLKHRGGWSARCGQRPQINIFFWDPSLSKLKCHKRLKGFY